MKSLLDQRDGQLDLHLRVQGSKDRVDRRSIQDAQNRDLLVYDVS